jgi:hypothetical protein
MCTGDPKKLKVIELEGVEVESEKMYDSRIRGGRTLVQSGHPAARGRYVEGVYGGTIRTVCWLSRN